MMHFKYEDVLGWTYTDQSGFKYSHPKIEQLVAILRNVGYKVTEHKQVVKGLERCTYDVEEPVVVHEYFVLVTANIKYERRYKEYSGSAVVAREYSFIHKSDKQDMQDVFNEIQKDAVLEQIFNEWFREMDSLNSPYFFIRNISKLR